MIASSSILFLRQGLPGSPILRQMMRSFSSKGENDDDDGDIQSKRPNSNYSSFFSLYPAYEFIKVETRGAQGNVGLVSFNRPEALNAISGGLMSELLDALQSFEENAAIGAIVITGSEKLFTGETHFFFA